MIQIQSHTQTALGEQNRTEHCCRKNWTFKLTQKLTDLNKNTDRSLAMLQTKELLQQMVKTLIVY